MARGRPRKTDPKEALKAAMLIFWKKGYDGTSMSDLVGTTGMSKPSLYATFGDKQKIYTKALMQYVQDFGMPIADNLIESTQPVKKTLRNYLISIADNSFDSNTPNGCLLINTIVESENGSPFLEELGNAYNDKKRSLLTRFLSQANQDGRLSKKHNIEALVEFFIAQSVSIPVMSKSRAKRSDIDRNIEMALSILEDPNE